MKIKQVKSDKAASPIGAYSQAIITGNFVFCSGQIGLDHFTKTLVRGGVEKETKQALINLVEILSTAGTNFKKVVRTEIFLADINDFQKVNNVYTEYFSSIPQPARIMVEVANLPKNAKVEISCIACIKG